MDRLSVNLEPRTVTGKKVKQLRKQGIVPASICGKGVENQNVQINEREFTPIYRQVGRTALVDLHMPQGPTQSAFVRQVQRNPITGQFVHIDFRVVDLRVEITADVPVVAVGENTLVERGQGVVVLPHTTLSVKGLPADLPQVIEIDISGLEDFTSVVHVRDLNLGSNLEFQTPEDEVVATLTASTMEAEEEEIKIEEETGVAVTSGETLDEEDAGDQADEDNDASE
jgi:large subunit ribosomal protein L25